LMVKNQKGKLLPIFQYPPSKASSKPSGKVYTFLVIGETGSGKTTLLDAFANFLGCQRFTDPFRWKLVDENHMKDKPTCQSQTSEVTYYYLWDERNCSKKLMSASSTLQASETHQELAQTKRLSGSLRLCSSLVKLTSWITFCGSSKAQKVDCQHVSLTSTNAFRTFLELMLQTGLF